MKRLILAMVLPLAGCVTDTVWYKEGASPAKINDAATNCAVQAARTVPQNPQIGQTPIYTTPMQTSCYGTSYVTCTTTGGNIYGGNLYTYDANSGLRDAVMSQCMAKRGYQSVELALCSQRVANAVTEVDFATLPKLTKETCLIDMGGSYRAVNP